MLTVWVALYHLQKGCHFRKIAWMFSQGCHGRYRQKTMPQSESWTRLGSPLSDPPHQICHKWPFSELSKTTERQYYIYDTDILQKQLWGPDESSTMDGPLDMHQLMCVRTCAPSCIDKHSSKCCTHGRSTRRKLLPAPGTSRRFQLLCFCSDETWAQAVDNCSVFRHIT